MNACKLLFGLRLTGSAPELNPYPHTGSHTVSVIVTRPCFISVSSQAQYIVSSQHSIFQLLPCRG